MSDEHRPDEQTPDEQVTDQPEPGELRDEPTQPLAGWRPPETAASETGASEDAPDVQPEGRPYGAPGPGPDTGAPQVTPLTNS